MISNNIEEVPPNFFFLRRHFLFRVDYYSELLFIFYKSHFKMSGRNEMKNILSAKLLKM